MTIIFNKFNFCGAAVISINEIQFEIVLVFTESPTRNVMQLVICNIFSDIQIKVGKKKSNYMI